MSARTRSFATSGVPDRAETLDRGDFVKLVYRLGRTRVTGVLAVYRPPFRPDIPAVDATPGSCGAEWSSGRRSDQPTNRPSLAFSTSPPAAQRPDVLVLRRGHLITPPLHPASSGSRAADTGVNSVQGSPPVVIRSGFSRVQIKRNVARQLAELAAAETARYTFDGGLAVYPPGALDRQVPMAAWARSHIEAQLDTRRAQRMIAELAGMRLLAVRQIAPDPALCDEIDRRILDAIRVPRRLDQIWTIVHTPRYRLLSFLHFLRTVGGLKIIGIAASESAGPAHRGAHHILGVPVGADRATVKRAYRRLARALHPDLHPEASDERRRSLERQLADVTSAYVELTNSAS
ncbi:MAG: J domain-containing protein [Proteobacteria bacterium]|nr:J domain-containing protein [Pseudomonadota bacterium]